MHIVIIGNGIAGNTAALTVKGYSQQTSLTLVSEEIHPLYSPCVLPHYLAGAVSRNQLFLKGLESCSGNKTRIILGQKAENIDTVNKKVYSSGETIPYDKLVIATGSVVTVPPIRGLEKEGVFTFKSLSDADRLSRWFGRKAVVIGSGFIGIEVAIALKRRGYEVCVIELLDWILPRAFDEYPASLLTQLLEQNDIRILVKERVNSITGDSKVSGIVTDKREIDCDTVIMATGMKPNVELAKQTGIKIGKLGGIEANMDMSTNMDDVYACGDCVEAMDLVSGEKALNLLWYNAKQQAEVAGSNCLGNKRQYHGSINITGVDIFGTQAVSLGTTSASVGQEKANRLEVMEKSWEKKYLRLIIQAGVLVGVQTVSWTRDLGLLLSAILRKEDLKLPREADIRLLPRLLLWRRTSYCK